MNKPTSEEIEQTIRAVSKAAADRHFKTEVNSYGRSSFVLDVIKAEVKLALVDLGVPLPTVEREIDIEPEVAQALRDRGYKVASFLEGVRNV